MTIPLNNIGRSVSIVFNAPGQFGRSSKKFPLELIGLELDLVRQVTPQT